MVLEAEVFLMTAMNVAVLGNGLTQTQHRMQTLGAGPARIGL